jgi:prepilin-type N-terminal cleavage/methylation domain-containing protein
MLSRKGFTLIELMVVIAIIGILGVVITPVVGKAIQKANASKIIAVLGTLTLACDMFYMDTGDYAVENSLQTGATEHNLFVDAATPIAGWDGPYIKGPLMLSSNPYRSDVIVWDTLAGGTASGTGFDLDSSGAAEATGDGNYVAFNGVPEIVADRIDTSIDGAVNNTSYRRTRGQVEFLEAGTTNIGHVAIFINQD